MRKTDKIKRLATCVLLLCIGSAWSLAQAHDSVDWLQKICSSDEKKSQHICLEYLMDVAWFEEQSGSICIPTRIRETVYYPVMVIGVHRFRDIFVAELMRVPPNQTHRDAFAVVAGMFRDTFPCGA